jgi:hypothetical protein
VRATASLREHQALLAVYTAQEKVKTLPDEIEEKI